MQFKFFGFQFKPTFLGTIITLICIPIFIKLGFWQYNKAKLGQGIQQAYTESTSNGALQLIEHLQLPEKLQYQKVSVAGIYEKKYQILIDNQVENGRAGFHVITPLKIIGSDQYVLVNRGWIAGKDKHTDIPMFDSPTGLLQVEGVAWIPSKKIFTLEGKSQNTSKNQSWQLVWQNLDMIKYEKIVPIKILPIIIKLDPHSNAGGFVRNWQIPSDRIMTNLSYAYQWFGFACAALAIYLYININRIKTN